MEIISKQDNIRISARKMRLVAPRVKGMTVAAALLHLRFTPKDAARPVIDVIKTAQADAVHNFKLKDEDKLIIKDVEVSEGPTYKRFRPVSKGRAHGIAKRTSNLKVTLQG
jgi:large subunit ribosomal protein L22